MAGYDSTITIGVQTVLDESKLTEAESKLTDLKETLNNTFSTQEDTGSKGIFESALSSVESLSTSVAGLRTIFADLGTSLSGNVTNAMRTVEQSISAMQRNLVAAAKSGFSSDSLNKVLMNSVSLSESSGLIDKLIQNHGKDLGWSQTQFSQKMPLIMSQIINPEVKRLSETAFLRDRPNFDRYVDALTENRAVRRSLDSMSGTKMSTEQARANIERGLLLYNQRAAQAFGADAVARAPFQRSAATIHPHDVIPEQFRGAYYGRGFTRTDAGANAEKAFLASLPKQGANYVSRATYQALRDYVQNNENGIALHDILREAGIMDVRGGTRQWAKHLTVAQASLLGGLSARELYNAKRGYAFYDADPNDSANDVRVDHRMSRRVQAQLGLMDILSRDSRITPSTNYSLEDLAAQNADYVVRVGTTAKTRIKGNRVTETGTPDQFVMPLTQVDARSGQLVYRDPTWHKKTGLYEEREDDQFAIMTDNPLAQLIRQIGYTGKGGHKFGYGNGTFGYGRNDKGEAIYDTPPILKINTDQFYQTDANGFDRHLDPAKEQQFRRILRGQQFSYGDRNYEYAYQGDSGVYMIESGLKKQIDQWYEKRNLPSFFAGLNEGGLESIEDYGKLIKQINGLKKGSSTAQTYEDVFGALEGHGKNGALNTRVANLTAWYKALGYSDADIPDGAAFGNSAVFRNGPLQMRSAVGFGKYVLNPYNLEQVFGAATAGFTKDQIANMGESYDNNWLFSKGANGGVQVWIPSITATEADVRALQTGELSEDQIKQYSKNEDRIEALRELRRQKFFVGNDANNDLILSDKTAKQFEAFKFLSGKHYAAEYGEEALKQAKAENRYDEKKGLVTLLPHEQGEMHERATPSYMVMRSAWDFANDPNIISQQSFAAWGGNQELRERSDDEFARRIYRLRTAEGRMEALKANPFYERMLNQNPNFAYSPEASSYIEKQIRELQDKQLAGYIAINPKDTVDQNGNKIEGIRSAYRVAALTPGALIEPILRAAGISDENIDSAVQSLLPSRMDASKQIYTGKGISGKAGQIMQINRDPDAAGQQIQVSSMYSTEAIRNKMREFGVSDAMADQAIFLSQRQAGALNTGDFDGDTVRAYLGLPEEALARAAQIQEAINAEKVKYEKAQSVRDVQEVKKPAVSVEQARLDALTRYFDSTKVMGQASKILRESMNLPDTDQTKWSRIYEGMKLYDFASSEMRTKGLDAVISEYGLETIKGGNSFERFLANMRKESGKEDEDLRAAHLGKDIFKTNLPSWNSPQGVVASLMRGREVLAGKSDYSDFRASMSKLMDMEYGDAQTPEAKAARWYADKYTKTAFGRLLTRKDLSEGDDLAYQWLRSLNNRNVAQDTEEYKQYNRFARRLGTMREADSMTYENMLERSASLQSAMGRETNEDKRRELQAQWALTEEAIRNHDTYEKDLTKLDNIRVGEEVQERKRAAEDAKHIEAQLKKEQEAEQQIDTSKDVWGKPSVAANWSNFKNWIHKPIQLTGAKQLTSSGAPIETGLDPILFNDYAARVNVATSELYGSKDETDHIVIGNAMHKAFENYWKGVAEGTLEGKTIDNYFTQLVTGDGEYARKLSDLGYKIRKTSKEEQPERYEAVGPEGTGLTKLNNLLRTSTNKGVSSMADFITALGQAGFDIEHPANIEGNFYKYDKQGNFEGADNTGKYEMKLSIPLKDEKGEIIGYDESKTTHARPDLMLRNKNDNGLYVVDYKSRYEGAAESLVQSAFYTSVIDTLAKRAWTGVHESEKDAEGNLRKLSDAEKAELESFKGAGHMENGKYVSDIKGAIGFDPRTRRSIMISREGENAQYFDEGVQLATEALTAKRIDAKGLMENGSAYIRAMMNEATISHQVDNQLNNARAAVTDSEGHLTRNLSDAEREFFLSRYQADREAISGVRSSIFKERDLPERYFNRFEGYERKLKEALPDDVVSAVMQSYAKDGYVDMNSPVIAELSEEMKGKARLLKDVQELGIEAATKDWEKAESDISRTFSGIGQTKTESTIEAVNRRVKQAESSRDFLKSRMVEVTDKNGNKTMIPVYKGYKKDANGNYQIADQAFAIEDQAQMFDTGNANTQVAARARTMKNEFLRSVQAQEQVERMIEASSEKFLKEDAIQQDQTWSSMIGEVKDPATILSQALTKKAAAAQKQIDTWNSEIQEWSDKLEKGDVSPGMRNIYQRLIDDRRARVASAESDVQSGLIEKSAIDEEKRRLGMTTLSPHNKAQKWLNERLAIVNEETKPQQLLAGDAFKRLIGLKLDPQSTLQEREAAERAHQDAVIRDEEIRRRNEELRKQREEQTASYVQQAQAYEEMLVRQENRPYDDFMNKANRTTLNRDERVQRQLDDMMTYATQQAMNKNLSEDARQKWTDLLGNKNFWDQQKEQLTQQDKEQEILRAKYEQNQLAAIRDQNDARVANMERQFDNANRQQRMRYSTSRIANAIYSVQQRREAAQYNYDNINRQAKAEERNSAYLKERMEAAPQGSKEYKDAAAAYAQSQEKLAGLTSAAGTAKEQLNQLNSIGTMGSAVFGSFAQSVNMLITRLGRQMFRKALNEAKKFVQEFDASMTSIQMITLKSDSQMSTLGDGLIAKAKEFKVSISDITKSAETLYRQGLSDQEVDERLGIISKFSKVSGTKTDAATKLITVAMNTGLVTDPQQAADIVTALGDNAATNASEIEKGIEKAGAAAAADGTTFAELASMLTAITSTTQIGGNVAGRTLNTIIGRMNKIGTNELIYDENGHAISGSAVAKLLQAQGISMYDSQGNKRSSYNTLYALSQKWEGMSDAEQQQIATAIAGTRQYSNFAAIMQGMAEGKVDEYMQLAGESEGITDKKYDVYLKSLQASLTDLKNTFDTLVHDLTKSGIAQDIIKGLTNIIQGVDNLVNSTGGLEKVVGLMVTLALSMAALKSGNPAAMLVGAAVAGVSLISLANSGASEKKVSAGEQALARSERETNSINSLQTDINKAKTYYEKVKEAGTSDVLSDVEKADFSGIITRLDNAFSDVASAADTTADKFIAIGDKLTDYQDELDEKKVKAAKRAFEAVVLDDAESLTESYNEYMEDKEGTSLNPMLYGNTTSFWHQAMIKSDTPKDQIPDWAVPVETDTGGTAYLIDYLKLFSDPSYLNTYLNATHEDYEKNHAAYDTGFLNGKIRKGSLFSNEHEDFMTGENISLYPLLVKGLNDGAIIDTSTGLPFSGTIQQLYSEMDKENMGVIEGVSNYFRDHHDELADYIDQEYNETNRAFVENYADTKLSKINDSGIMSDAQWQAVRDTFVENVMARAGEMSRPGQAEKVISEERNKIKTTILEAEEIPEGIAAYTGQESPAKIEEEKTSREEEIAEYGTFTYKGQRGLTKSEADALYQADVDAEKERSKSDKDWMKENGRQLTDKEITDQYVLTEEGLPEGAYGVTYDQRDEFLIGNTTYGRGMRGLVKAENALDEKISELAAPYRSDAAFMAENGRPKADWEIGSVYVEPNVTKPTTYDAGSGWSFNGQDYAGFNALGKANEAQRAYIASEVERLRSDEDFMAVNGRPMAVWEIAMANNISEQAAQVLRNDKEWMKKNGYWASDEELLEAAGIAVPEVTSTDNAKASEWFALEVPEKYTAEGWMFNGNWYQDKKDVEAAEEAYVEALRQDREFMAEHGRPLADWEIASIYGVDEANVDDLKFDDDWMAKHGYWAEDWELLSAAGFSPGEYTYDKNHEFYSLNGEDGLTQKEANERYNKYIAARVQQLKQNPEWMAENGYWASNEEILEAAGIKIPEITHDTSEGWTYTNSQGVKIRKDTQESAERFRELELQEKVDELKSNPEWMAKHGFTISDEDLTEKVKATLSMPVKESRFINSIIDNAGYVSKSDTAKAAGDEVYKEIANLGIDSFASLMSNVDEGNVSYWQNLMATNPAVADKLREYVQINDDGSYSIKNNENPAQWAAFMEYLASLSKDFSATNIQTREQQTANARTAYTQYTKGQKITDVDSITGHSELQKIIGDKLYGKWMTGELGTEEQKYIDTLLENYQYGLSDLTASQRLTGIKDVRRNIGRLGAGYDREIADKYMSSWSGWSEYASLKERQANGEVLSGAELKRVKDLELSLDNFQKNAEINIEVEGIQSLEEAGNLLAGTSALVEKLKKGGTFEIEAKVSYRAESFEVGQQRAKLYGGTQEQQYAAAMAQLKMNEEEFYQDTEGNLAAAKANDAANRTQEAESIMQLYKTQNNIQGQQDIIKYANSRGFKWDNGRFVFDESLLNVAAVNPLLTESQTYTEAETKEALSRILSGDLVYSNETADLYKAAYGSAGTYTRELIKRRARGETPSEGLIRASENERYNEPTFTAEDYDLTTAGGALKYKNLSYEQANRSAIAANEIYQSLTSGNIQSFSDLVTSVNDTDVKNWADLIGSSDELRSKFKDMGVTVGEDGKIDFSGVEASGYSLATVLDTLAQAAANASDHFNKIAEVLSTGETYQRATDYLAGTLNPADEQKGFEALSQVTGNSQLAQIVRNNLATQVQEGWHIQDGKIIDQTGNIKGVWNPYAGLTNYNTRYAQTLFNNAAIGISGLTDIQRYEGLQEIISAARDHTLGTLREEDKIGAFTDFTHGIEGADKWLAGNEALNKVGLDMSQLGELSTEDYAKAEKALAGIFDNVEVAIDANEKFNQSVAETGQKLRTTGDYIDSYALGLKASSKNLKESNAAAKAWNQTLAEIMKNQKTRTQFREGKGKAEDVAALTGRDKVEVKDKKNKQSILDQLQAQEQEDMAVIESYAAGYLDDINALLQEAVGDQTLEVAFPDVEITGADGAVNFDAIAAIIGTDAANAMQALAQQLAALGIKTHFDVTEDGDGAPQIRLVVDSLGRGGGGGGGGGGGKSATDKLLEAQKHRIQSIEHENKMTDYALDDAARENNQGEYSRLLEQRIAGQTKLRDAYQKNLEELKKQLATLNKESEDWWKVQEAIQAAEEAIAGYNAEIDKLLAKKLQEIKEKYDFDTSEQTHQGNLHEIEQRRRRRLNDYVGQREGIAQRAADIQAQIAIDEGYADKLRAELSELQAAGKGDSDRAREIKTELNKLIEQIASAREDIADLANDINTLNQTIKENEMTTPTHMANMASTSAEIARRNRNWGQASAIYDQQQKINQQMRAVLSASIERQTADLATMTIGSQEWFTALRQIYADQEELLQLTISDMDIALQRINDMRQAYDEMFAHMQHGETMTQHDISVADYYNDYDALFTGLNDYTVRLQARQQRIHETIEQYTIKLAEAETEEAREQIRQFIEQLQEEDAQITEQILNMYQQRVAAMQEHHQHELAPLQHEQRMLGYDETLYGRLNDYDNYIATLDASTQSHRDTIATLRSQRAELVAEQALVREGSDAWWAWQQQIDEVDEALRRETQAIDENNKKRLQALRIRTANQDKPEQHQFDMLSLISERADLLDDNEMWEGAANDRLAAINDAIAQNAQQQAEWEALLATYVEGSQEWIDARDEIWKIKKNTAQLENEALRIEQQIDARRLQEIQKAETRANAPYTHENKMLDTAASLYQNYGMHGNYQAALAQQAEAYGNVYENALAARDAALAEMATLEKYSQSWYNARDAVYAYEEQMASAMSTKYEKLLAIEQDKVNALTQQIQDSSLAGNIRLTELRNAQQRYDKDNDYEGYQQAGQRVREQLEIELETKRRNVEEMKALLKDTTKNTTAWFTLRQQIAQALIDISNSETEIDDLDRQQQQAEIDHLLEKMNWDDSNLQHRRTLVQYDETKYQNAGQLTMYGKKLQEEESLIRESIDAEKLNIKTIKDKMDSLREAGEQGTDDYRRLVEELKKHEEALRNDSAELEKNIKMQEENANAIQKTRKELEDVVDKELRTREEERKKRLDAEVKLQKTILDTIKQNYKDQWKLETDDINKKKEALEKEKSLINERLNARKKAMETEDKYRELEELKRQLALISNDPTRTRDAKELREKINDIEKDISWERATEEAENATKQIDDEISAMNDYVTTHGDNLEEMLSNANNFAEEIARIMEGGWDSISEFLTTNNQEFLNSTEIARQQMEEGWRETWETMTGYAKTYWDQVAEILSSYESFVEFMKDSTEYINSSEAGKAVLQYGWDLLYQNWLNSGLITEDEGSESADEHPYEEGHSDTTLSDIFSGDSDWLNYGKEPPAEINEDLMHVDNYDDVGLDEKPHAVELTNIQTDDTYEGVGITREEEEAGYEGGEDHNIPINTDEETLTIEQVLAEVPMPTFTPEDYTPPDDLTQIGVKRHKVTWENWDGSKIKEEEFAEGEQITYTGDNPTKANDGDTTYTFSGWTPTPGVMGTSDLTFKAAFTDYTPPALEAPTEPEQPTQPRQPQGQAQPINNHGYDCTVNGVDYKASGFASKQDAQEAWIEKLQKIQNMMLSSGTPLSAMQSIIQNSRIHIYKHGGLVDYTGPAWVDGTPSQPEAFLSAVDTKMIKALTVALNSISISPGIMPPTSDFSTNTNVGDINITINQAELKDDADYEDVARRVGKAFTKELSKNGFNLTGYNL